MLLSTKLYQGSFRLGIRKYFFSERVVKDWNSLPWEMLEGFKRYVDIVVEWTHLSDGVGSAVLMVEWLNSFPIQIFL